MSKRRDRHERGLRGPMAARSSLNDKIAPLRRRESAADFFAASVDESLAKINRDCPQALAGMNVGIEEVPTIRATLPDDHVPLAAAMERTPLRPGQVVIYRRPLEHRARSRKELAQLVYRTLVEQLAAATGLDASTIDPHGDAEPDD